MSKAMTKLVPWLMTVVLLAAAWAVVKVTPPEVAAQASFERTAQVGEQAAARNFAVTITDVHVARRVVDATGWAADGTWVVVDVEASARLTQRYASLGLAQLIVGDRTYVATERGTTFYRQNLVTEVDRSGSLAFELPEAALTGSATLRIGVPTGLYGEVALDDVVVLPVDLDDLPVEAEATLQENGWAR